jgi:hypothetical protein
MEIGQIVFVLVLVLVFPLALAWAQSRWEISRERRRAARMSSRTTPPAAADSGDQAISVQDGERRSASATDASVPVSRTATSRAGVPVDDPWKRG